MKINPDGTPLTGAMAVTASPETPVAAITDSAPRIEPHRRRQDRRRVELLTSPGRPFPGVDLDSTSELLDRMDGIV